MASLTNSHLCQYKTRGKAPFLQLSSAHAGGECPGSVGGYDAFSRVGVGGYEFPSVVLRRHGAYDVHHDCAGGHVPTHRASAHARVVQLDVAKRQFP